MADQHLHAVAFPKLGAAELSALGQCPQTKVKRYRDGAKLFEAGQRDWNFYIVKSGRVEVVDDSDDPPRTVAVHGPGEFTGDVAQLTGAPAIVSAVARGDTEVFEVSPEACAKS